ncbi:MAG: hypothetical protein VX501_08650 [Pseudomonadota bacterium]|nr:hypothetical protein [Pseudomonadota bacterium]
MRQLLVLAAVCAGLGACSTTGGEGAAGDLALSAFDYASSDATRQAGSRFGYQLASDDGWQGDLAFEEDSGVLSVVFTMTDGTEAELRVGMPYLEDGVRRYHGSTIDGLDVFVELQAGPCEQGGDTLTHFAMVEIGSNALEGCGLERAEIDRWSNYLMDFLPAIDTCLGELGARAQHVSLAYSQPGGNTGVRLVDQDGATWECTTREDDTAINSIRQLNAADALLGEGDPVFVRSRMPAFGDACYVYESVRLADGALVGALGYDTCDSVPMASLGNS